MDEALARCSLIVPTFNEAPTIRAVLETVDPRVGEVLVVDGYSTDGTVDVVDSLAQENVRVLHRPGFGKGNGLQCGIQAAEGDYIVALDSDGSHDARDVFRLVEELLLGSDVVKGFRENKSFMTEPARELGRWALNESAAVMLGRRFEDICCGFVAMRSSVALEILSPPSSSRRRSANLGQGFEIDALLVARAVRAGSEVSEVGVSYGKRVSGRSKTRAVRDFARILRALEGA